MRGGAVGWLLLRVFEGGVSGIYCSGYHGFDSHCTMGVLFSPGQVRALWGWNSLTFIFYILLYMV